MDNNYDCRKTGEEVELEREKFEWYKEQYEREREEAKQKSVKEAENERNTAIATVVITGIILIGPFIVAGVCGLVELIGNKVNERKARKKGTFTAEDGTVWTYNKETKVWEVNG